MTAKINIASCPCCTQEFEIGKDQHYQMKHVRQWAKWQAKVDAASALAKALKGLLAYNFWPDKPESVETMSKEERAARAALEKAGVA